MEKFEKEVHSLNDDEEFFRLMTDEEENETLKNTYIGRGFKQGEKSGKQEIAKIFSEVELAKEIGATSIGFVSVEGILGSLEDIIPENFGYCTNCFR